MGYVNPLEGNGNGNCKEMHVFLLVQEEVKVKLLFWVGRGLHCSLRFSRYQVDQSDTIDLCMLSHFFAANEFSEMVNSPGSNFELIKRVSLSHLKSQQNLVYTLC